MVQEGAVFDSRVSNGSPWREINAINMGALVWFLAASQHRSITAGCHHLIHRPDGNIQRLHFLSFCIKERKQALPSCKQHIYICFVATTHKQPGLPSSNSLSYEASS